MNKRWRLLSRFCRDRSGTIAVLTALSLTGLVGFAGLGIETTQWYTEKRSIQAAADDAALSAAVAYSQGNTTGYTTEAKSVAGTNGFVDTVNNVSVTVAKPPTSGPYASNNSAIQVSIVAPATPLLSKMFIGNFNVGGGSVALVGTQAAGGCVMALNGAAAGAGTLSGTTNITLNNCSFVVNSNSSSALVMNGNATLTAANVVLGGGDSVSNNSTLTTTGGVLMYQPPVTDPYASRTIPTRYRDLSYLGKKSTDVVAGSLLQRLGLHRRRHHAQSRRLRPRQYRPQPRRRRNPPRHWGDNRPDDQRCASHHREHRHQRRRHRDDYSAHTA